MIYTSERDTPVYCWFSRCTILVIFNICVRIIWCQFAVGRFSDWEAVWWWCNGFFFSCYPIIDFQLTCTALNTSAGRKINPLPTKKGGNIDSTRNFLCLTWVWICFVVGGESFCEPSWPISRKSQDISDFSLSERIQRVTYFRGGDCILTTVMML